MGPVLAGSLLGQARSESEGTEDSQVEGEVEETSALDLLLDLVIDKLMTAD